MMLLLFLAFRNHPLEYTVHDTFGSKRRSNRSPRMVKWPKNSKRKKTLLAREVASEHFAPSGNRTQDSCLEGSYFTTKLMAQ